MRIADIEFETEINGWKVYETPALIYAFKDKMLLIFEDYEEFVHCIKENNE